MHQPDAKTKVNNWTAKKERKKKKITNDESASLTDFNGACDNRGLCGQALSPFRIFVVLWIPLDVVNDFQHLVRTE